MIILHIGIQRCHLVKQKSYAYDVMTQMQEYFSLSTEPVENLSGLFSWLDTKGNQQWPCKYNLQLINSWWILIGGRCWHYNPGTPLLTWFNLNPSWISNHMRGTVWGEITDPFPNFNASTVEVWEWISNFIQHFIMDLITYPCWDLSYFMSVKGVPGCSLLLAWIRFL